MKKEAAVKGVDGKTVITVLGKNDISYYLLYIKKYQNEKVLKHIFSCKKLKIIIFYPTSQKLVLCCFMFDPFEILS